MVGINTVKCDNPRLTCRIENKKSPTRIILDTDLEIDLDAFVVTDAFSHPTIILTHKQDNQKIELLKQKNVQIILIDKVEDKFLDLDECFTKLYEHNISSIIVEGGSQLLGSLLMKNKINELITYVGHKLIGGNQALTPIGGLGFSSMQDTLNLALYDYQIFDNDIKLHYLIERKEYQDVFRNYFLHRHH